jgi:hypothetical protein
METGNKTSLIKISSQDWVRIGIDKGWLLNKKAQMTMDFPTSSAPTSGSGERSSSSSFFSSFGMSDLVIATLLLNRRKPNMDDAAVKLEAEKLVANKQELLQKAVDQGIISKDQMTNVLAGKTDNVGSGTPGAVSKVHRIARFLGIAAVSAGGYYAGSKATDVLADHFRANNTVSPEIMRQKGKSISKFKEGGAAMVDIGRKISGISNSLDKDLALLANTVLDIIRQLSEPNKNNTNI